MLNYFKTFSKSSLIQLCSGVFILTLGLIFWSCDLSQNPKGNQTVSFTSLFDSVSTYDSVLIVFKTEAGKTIDTVFHNRVPPSRSGFQKLVVNKWDGGKAVILIRAYQADIVVYEVEKHFDGTTDTTEKTFVIVEAGPNMASPIREIQLMEGDSLPFPIITFKPESTTDKTVL